MTRSLLGWGVLAGPVFFAVGLALALTRDGFDLTTHQLSLLMLGDHGWLQRANLLSSFAMVAAAALGVHRARRQAPHPRVTAVLVAGFALGLLGSGIFPPDPMAGFPPGASEDVTASGILHLVFGLVTFGCAAAAALTLRARWSRVLGFLVVLGFVGGAVLARSGVGVAMLWAGAGCACAWLATVSTVLYRSVPHPDERNS